MSERDEEVKKQIAARIGDFSGVPCCVDPTRTCPPDKCNLYYESAGSLVVRAGRSGRTLEDEAKKWVSEGKKANESPMKKATLRMNLRGKGVDPDLCFKEPKQ
jgi:plasmid stability protein